MTSADRYLPWEAIYAINGHQAMPATRTIRTAEKVEPIAIAPFVIREPLDGGCTLYRIERTPSTVPAPTW